MMCIQPGFMPALQFLSFKSCSSRQATSEPPGVPRPWRSRQSHLFSDPSDTMWSNQGHNLQSMFQFLELQFDVQNKKACIVNMLVEDAYYTT